MEAPKSILKPTQEKNKGLKRMKSPDEEKLCDGMRTPSNIRSEPKQKKKSSKFSNYSDPFEVSNIMEKIKFGSVTEDMKYLLEKKRWIFASRDAHPREPLDLKKQLVKKENPKLDEQPTSLARQDVIDVDNIGASMESPMETLKSILKPTQEKNKGLKRMKSPDEEKLCDGMRTPSNIRSEPKQKKKSSKFSNYSDPFEVSNIMEKIKFGSVTEDMKYLLEKKRRIFASRDAHPHEPLDLEKQLVKKENPKLDEQPTSLAGQDVIDVDNIGAVSNVPASNPPIIIIDSDDEEAVEQSSSSPSPLIVLKEPALDLQIKESTENCCARKQNLREGGYADENEIREDRSACLSREHDTKTEGNNHIESNIGIIIGDKEISDCRSSCMGVENTPDGEGNRQTDSDNAMLVADNGSGESNCMTVDMEIDDDDTLIEVSWIPVDMEIQNDDTVIVDANHQTNLDSTRFSSDCRAIQIEEDEGNDQIVSDYDDVNEGTNLDDTRSSTDSETEENEGNDQIVPDSDDLESVWNEMNFALECSKDTDDMRPKEQVRDEKRDCDHCFVLKEDLGDVCRVCGVVKRGIETIIEYQLAKSTRSTRTYYHEARISNGKDANDFIHNGSKLSGLDIPVKDLAIHPRHGKQMKLHQLEGFKFLLSNLVTDNPGGCILAHAPGSGKTFIIISFMQSFLAKYPQARPLVVLPRGILTTWKKEFSRWQVEDVPLYDFYSARADSRAQQLEVIKQWAGHKSILFLGYKQFSSIVCDNEPNETAASCQRILLECPSILILDEGHTPRNEETDVLSSLKKVQTPRKVVLSGTLYQNHVKEVFNIFDLVHTKFLKQDSSRAIINRVLSKVPNARKYDNANSRENVFYESVESTLQKDQNFKRKIAIIRDLREMTSKVLHFYKGDFLDELPGLEDFTVFLNLSHKQKEGVKELRNLNQRFKVISEGSALYVHPNLRNHLKSSPKREKEGVDDEKMDRVIEKSEIHDGVKAKFFLNILGLCESTGEKLLVFSQYIQPLKFLERLVVKMKGWSVGNEIFVITGDSSSESRDSSMEQFNNSSFARVFFGSIKACGEGISLVGASRIIILDVHLNPSVTRQAIGRAFRPGQERKVYTYRLVAAESPEEDDHSTCFRKESIAKMWFEWTECCGQQEFEMRSVDVSECGDKFLESPKLSADIQSLYKR